MDVLQSNDVRRLELPKTLAEYQRLSLKEKAERFPFERITDDKEFNYFMNYLTDIGSSMGFSEAYDEFAEISEYCNKMQEEKLVDRGGLEKLGIEKDLMEVYDEFDDVYKESMTGKKKDDKEWRR